MRVFLTGSTGYLGSAIAAALVRGRHDVTALVRSSTSAARVRSYGIEPLHGDLRDPSTYRTALETAEAIVHAAVESGPERIDVDRVFVDAALGPKLVYTSVMFVLGNVDGADESAVGSGARAEHERLVLDAGGTVIRPGMILDEESWLLQDPIYIDEGTNRWPIVARDRVADLYRLVVEQRAKGVFHAVSSVIRARDLAPDSRSIPLGEARAAMGPFADMLALDQNVSAERARRELGWVG